MSEKGRFGNQDSREVTLNIAQLTALPWCTAAEGWEENRAVWEHHEMKRTHRPVQLFLLHTESLSNSACLCGTWIITILHPSVGLISSLADSTERKDKCWLSQREWHLPTPAVQGKPGLSLPVALSSIPSFEDRLQNKAYSFQFHKHPLLSEIRNVLFWPLWSHSNRENNSLSILPCCISGSWKPFTSRKLLQQLPWWLW